MQFALGSSLVEILEAFLAIGFGLAIERFLREHAIVQMFIVIGFIAVGFYFIFRGSHPKLEKKSKFKTSEFWQGVLVALLNPQAVPFWLFALALVAPYEWLDFVGANLYIFLLAVFLGKLLALFIFARSSNYLKKYLEECSHWVDRSFGLFL